MNHLVTSLAEVWIETWLIRCSITATGVTSLVEVWIETSGKELLVLWNFVTSLAEVWIETFTIDDTVPVSGSLPLRKCGLKPPCAVSLFATIRSLPLRKCGLKRKKK